jgi:hypothetical protein
MSFLAVSVLLARKLFLIENFLIENCLQWGICTDDDASSCPTPSRDWCPFNFFRSVTSAVNLVGDFGSKLRYMRDTD